MSEFVTFKQYIERYAGEHEIFMSFFSDWMAEAFEHWWIIEGKEKFECFCQKEYSENYKLDE